MTRRNISLKRVTSLLFIFGLLLMGVLLLAQPACPGEECGEVTCPVGLVCCNPIEGICARPGDPCIQ
ncbi:MAG: hypothetical protein D6812_13555 [Deltaproteobacteria bacterium]|nr:MAG: hypothetical protein D6812_13555 [Deltaproteobacteria bacterium]